MTPARELSRLLATQAAAVCAHLLPQGREHKGDWLAGSTGGDAGKSLHVRLTGERAGLWIDFANPDDRGDLLTLWQRNRGLDFASTCKEVAVWLELPEEHRPRPIVPNPAPQARDPSRTWELLQRNLAAPTDDELRTIALQRRLPAFAGLRRAASAGTLFTAPVFDDGFEHPAWIITDGSRRTAQARRMDGQTWEGIGGKKAKTIAGTQANWPVGCHGLDTEEVLMVEGGPDFLAAHHLAWWSGRDATPVAMLGAAQTIPDDALSLLSGRSVWIYAHTDDNRAGEKGAIRWAAQLQDVGCIVRHADLRTKGYKDLNELVTATSA